MTRKEKLKAINDRVGTKFAFENELCVSVMLIANILDKLSQKGLVEAPLKVSPMGRNIVAICEEFEWEILDEDIQIYCNDLIPPEERNAFIHFIKTARDGT